MLQSAKSLGLCFALTSTLVSGLFGIQAKAATDNDFAKATDLIHLPLPYKLSADGKIEADSSKWKIEHDGDSTDLLTSKSGDETRIAAMKNADGAIESFTSYVLKNAKKSESDTTVFFDKGKMTAYTTCEDTGAKDSLGRVCVTATPQLCQSLKKGDGVEVETLKQTDLFEMRALAAILTLRGPDHQLENVVKSGNRLGLKSGLQTTKGQIYALVKQQAKDGKRDLATETAETKLADSVLSKSLPRLKEACISTKF